MRVRNALSDGTGVPPRPLSVNDLDRLMRNLPTAQRAAIAWAPAELRAAINSLRGSTDLSAEDVARASEKIFRLLESVIGPVAASIGAEELSVEVSALWAKELECLRGFLPDSASVHAAEWTFRSLDRTFRAVLASAGSHDWAVVLSQLKDKGMRREAFSSEFGGFFRAQALLMAAIAEAEEHGKPENAARLVDEAFLEMSGFIDVLVRAGLQIDPYADEADAERANRLLAYVQDIRETLTSEDIERTVRTGHLGQLR
jgi:hypothetical protein